MEFVKLVLNEDFLLFVLGMLWLDIAQYIQNKLATCNVKVFGIALAGLFYMAIKHLMP